MSALRLVLSSWPDEDELVAEIWCGDKYLRDVRRRDAGIQLRLTHTREAGGLDLDDFLEVFAAARRHFRSARRVPTASDHVSDLRLIIATLVLLLDGPSPA